MKVFANLTDKKLVDCLMSGGVVVLPTDTLYGIVARAFDAAAVARLYKIRGRVPEKPSIVLVASIDDITDRSLWAPQHLALAKKYWPGSVSIIMPSTGQTPAYLAHPVTRAVAYRVPADSQLRNLLAQTGPLIAPSANHEGQKPATTLQEAFGYFGDVVDGYVDGGDLSSAVASTLVAVEGGEVTILRPGAVDVHL